MKKEIVKPTYTAHVFVEGKGYEDIEKVIEVGTQASGTYFSDMTPFEVIKISPSGKTVTIREMDWKVIEGGEHDGSAKYEYTSNPNQHPVAVRRHADGYWRTSSRMVIYFGNARRYFDPTF